MNYFSWEYLATQAGAVIAVGLIVQITKEWGFIKKIPTQLWSYILAVLVMIPATVFGTIEWSVSTLTLIPFNAFIVAIGANGGFAVIQRLSGTDTDGVLNIDPDNPEKDTYELNDPDKFQDKRHVTFTVNGRSSRKK